MKPLVMMTQGVSILLPKQCEASSRTCPVEDVHDEDVQTVHFVPVQFVRKDSASPKVVTEIPAAQFLCDQVPDLAVVADDDRPGDPR